MTLCVNAVLTGVEEPEAEAGWELPEDHVLSSSPLPDLHPAEDAKHRPGYGGKSERPSPRPVKVSQWDEGPVGFPDLQICHVLPKELKKRLVILSPPVLLTKSLLLVYLGCCVTRACAKKKNKNRKKKILCSFESQRLLNLTLSLELN